MKKLFKYGSVVFLTALFSIMIAVDANAQRGAFHGGGGGATRVGVSGGFGGGRVGVGFGGSRFYGGGYGYFGYPRLGFYLGALPYGYYPFFYGDYPYYYANGIFYTESNGGYAVTTPPVGAAIPSLPRAAKSIMIDNQQYYEFNGVYYKIVVNDKGQKVYVVAGKDGVLNTDGDQGDDQTADTAPLKVGDIVDQLPQDARRITLNGKRYFVGPDDVYYEQIKDNNGNTAYRVASTPDEQPAPATQQRPNQRPNNQ
jgi:hypothetical protein